MGRIRIDIDKQKLLDLYNSGMGTRAIATKFNIEKSTVLRNMKDYGIQRRTSGEHSIANTRLYRIWAGIKIRCLNKNDAHYKTYGGRGIKMCNEWIDDPVNFYNWAVKNGYNDKLSIDRIDNNGNYESSNCKWSTPKEQANNTRSNHYITINGVTKTLSQWAEEVNAYPGTILRRLNRGVKGTQLLVKGKRAIKKITKCGGVKK